MNLGRYVTSQRWSSRIFTTESTWGILRLQDLTDPGDVPVDLGDQFIGACKADLVAEPFDEEDVQNFPVDILIKIEDVDLDGELLIGECRVEADAEDSMMAVSFEEDMDGVDAAGRGSAPCRADVRRREAEIAAPVVAGDHLCLRGCKVCRKARRRKRTSPARRAFRIVVLLMIVSPI